MLSSVWSAARRFVVKHGLKILAGAAMASAITSLAMSVRAGYLEASPRYVNFKDYIKCNWYGYVPSIISTLSCCACTGALAFKSTKTITALKEAIGTATGLYTTYSEAVKQNNPEVHQQTMDQLIKTGDVMIFDNVNDTQLTFGVDEEKRQFYDMFSMQYFESTIQQVMQAEYWVNRRLATEGEVLASDFYEYLGLPDKGYYHGLGFRLDEMDDWVDFDNQTRMVDDMQVLVIDMPVPWKNLMYQGG